MTIEEKRAILAERLTVFRSWHYERLAERVERDGREHDCLDHIEETAPDGTEYQIEFNAFWNDKPNGDVRVCGFLTAEPQRPILPFIPIDTADVGDEFIMRPDGTFVGEPPTTDN
ncbi:MAG: hypothetical protein WD066_13860 [Planctomycetaceae bacterium]